MSFRNTISIRDWFRRLHFGKFLSFLMIFCSINTHEFLAGMSLVPFLLGNVRTTGFAGWPVHSYTLKAGSRIRLPLNVPGTSTGMSMPFTVSNIASQQASQLPCHMHEYIGTRLGHLTSGISSSVIQSSLYRRRLIWQSNLVQLYCSDLMCHSYSGLPSKQIIAHIKSLLQHICARVRIPGGMLGSRKIALKNYWGKPLQFKSVCSTVSRR